MTPEEIEARERILQAAIAIIDEEDEPEQITIRQIALRAKVGVGLINYHFQSKENLLQQAVKAVTGALDDQWQQMFDPAISDPVERLKAMLRTNASVGVSNPKYVRILVLHELLYNEISVPLVLLPVLREIFGQRRSEQDLRVMAYALVTTMQVIAIRERAFRRYAGVDIFNPVQRDTWVNQMVDQILFGGKA
jgi:AcrR family transcriptional regulator